MKVCHFSLKIIFLGSFLFNVGCLDYKEPKDNFSLSLSETNNSSLEEEKRKKLNEFLDRISGIIKTINDKSNNIDRSTRYAQKCYEDYCNSDFLNKSEQSLLKGISEGRGQCREILEELLISKSIHESIIGWLYNIKKQSAEIEDQISKVRTLLNNIFISGSEKNYLNNILMRIENTGRN